MLLNITYYLNIKQFNLYNYYELLTLFSLFLLNHTQTKYQLIHLIPLERFEMQPLDLFHFLKMICFSFQNHSKLLIKYLFHYHFHKNSHNYFLFLFDYHSHLFWLIYLTKHPNNMSLENLSKMMKLKYIMINKYAYLNFQ